MDSPLYRLALVMTGVWNLFAGPALAQFCADYGQAPRLVGRTDTAGSARSVELFEGLAFVSDFTEGVKIVDVGSSDSPSEIATISIGGSLHGARYQDGYLYIAGFSPGQLVIADVSNPQAPMVVGSVAMPELVMEVDVQGSYAYVADGYGGLQVVDVTDVTSPQIVASLPPQDFMRYVKLVGDRAFVCDNDAGLHIIDISNPLQPSILGTVETAKDAYHVDVSGGYAYLVDASEGLHVVDISDETNPTIVAQVNEFGWEWSVSVRDDFAFVSRDGQGLMALNVANPAAPQILGSIPVPGSARDVLVPDGLAYVADDRGLQIIDLHPLQFIESIASDQADYVSSVAAHEDHAYLAMSNSLRVQSVTNPNAPQQVGHLDLNAFRVITSHAATKDFVFLGTLSDEYPPEWNMQDPRLYVVDVSDPTQPGTVGSVGLSGQTRGMDVAGSWVYVCGGNVDIVDWSNPFSPVKVKTLVTPGWAESAAVEGDRLYVADDAAGLVIADVSDPSSPVILGSVDTPGVARDVEIWNGDAYLVDGNSGLHRVDVTDPAAPVILHTVSLVDFARRLAIEDGIAYIAAYNAGIHVVDLDATPSPRLLSSFNTSGNARDVAVSNGIVHVADYQEGYVILPTHCEEQVATLVQQFEATATDQGVRFEFLLEGIAGPLRLEGHERFGTWDVPLSAAGEGRFTAFDDSPHARQGGLVHYSLLMGTGNSWQRIAERTVSVAGVPTAVRLHRVTPNPFNPSTRVDFELDRTQLVELTVYDLAGRRVRSLLRATRPAGRHELNWDGLDDHAQPVGSGVYLVRLDTTHAVRTTRAVLIR